MPNGNRRTLADCDQHMAEMREQINDLRAERDRLHNELVWAKEARSADAAMCRDLERENERLKGWRDRVREQESGNQPDEWEAIL